MCLLMYVISFLQLQIVYDSFFFFLRTNAKALCLTSSHTRSLTAIIIILILNMLSMMAESHHQSDN